MAKVIKKKTSQKTTKKTSKKRKKSGFSEGLRAFLLVGILVALSALISCGVIMIHSSINKNNELASLPDEAQETLSTEIVEETPIIKPEETQIKVIVQPEQTQNVNQLPPPVSENISYVTNTPSKTSVKPVENAGILVFVIDDAGNNLRELDPFLRVPGPLTIAVLPGLPNSAEAARRIRNAGKEVILHQPMEALGGQDPGPGAIYSGMNADEIKRVLARNVAEVGPVKGINNHQGSKITMDKDAMKVILEFCKENNLYFLDSRTTADTVAPAVARQIGLKITERNVFIDNEQNKDAMLRYINNGLARSQKNGSAVMIGHTWSPDLALLLTEQFPVFIEQGYTIKTALDIIN